MTTLLNRPGPPPPDESTEAAPAPPVVAGAIAALRAAALGILTSSVVVVLAWATAAHTTASSTAAVRAAVVAWLLAHHANVGFPGGQVAAAPLGLVAVPAVYLVLAARRAARSAAVADLRAASRLLGALTVVYAVLAGVAAVSSGAGGVRPGVPSAVLGGFAVAAVAGTGGVLREVPEIRARWATVPGPVRAVAAGAACGSAVVLAAGALLAGAALAVSGREAARVATSLDPGVVGSLLLFGSGVLFVPNAVVWAASYAVGPGFAVGATTAVAPSGAAVGAVPAFPIFAALPGTGPAPVGSLLVLLAPVAGGVLAGLVVVRREIFVTPESAALWGGVAGVLAGGAIGVLAALSGGAVGPGRLAAMGPPALHVGGLAAVELGLVAAGTAWIAVRRMQR
ncbi:MAG: DUF6350 family protein [Actinomycetota bacterium]|nr:DUF6350 family protein [Actinomycetota bacterium]